ncbi:uncharacterized protein [Cherax quadricarinatus]
MNEVDLVRRLDNYGNYGTSDSSNSTEHYARCNSSRYVKCVCSVPSEKQQAGRLTRCESHRRDNMERCTQCGVHQTCVQNRVLFQKCGSLQKTVRCCNARVHRTVAVASSTVNTVRYTTQCTPSGSLALKPSYDLSENSIPAKPIPPPPPPSLSVPSSASPLVQSSILPNPSSVLVHFPFLLNVSRPDEEVHSLSVNDEVHLLSVNDEEVHPLSVNTDHVVNYLFSAVPVTGVSLGSSIYKINPNTTRSVIVFLPSLIYTAISDGDLHCLKSFHSLYTRPSVSHSLTISSTSFLRPHARSSTTPRPPPAMRSTTPAASPAMQSTIYAPSLTIQSTTPAASPTIQSTTHVASPTLPSTKSTTSESTPTPVTPKLHTRAEPQHRGKRTSISSARLLEPSTCTPEGEVHIEASPARCLRSKWTSKRGSCHQRGGDVLTAAFTMLAVVFSTAYSYELKPTTTVSSVVLAGRTAKLPCELPLPPDRPTLILWYKDQATKPFYSFDARETATGHHKVHEDSQLGKRSRFRPQTFPYAFKARLGFLEVESISLADAGNYTCRVDFMTSQTMMSLLQLSVHEEVRSLKVFDAYENMVGEVAGPYELSSRVMLSCRAYGGYPLPVVEWVSGDQLLESSLTQPASTPTHRARGRGGEAPTTVVGVILHLPSLRREDNGREVTCVASNTNLTNAQSHTISIQMYLPPLEVSVEGVEEPLRAGVEAGILCRTSGSTPPAQLTWNITGSAALTTLPAQSSLDQNTTIRRGRLLPSPDDHGRTLTCTATNPQVPDYFLASTHTLNVLFAPLVEARLAPALDPGNIKEGEDVYFECHISANPPESRVIWLHKGEPLHTARGRGVLAQGRNLVLQKVSRQARGHYQCRVSNTIDTVTSEPASLDVMFAPECRGPKNQTVSVTASEEVKLECVVESNPAPTDFLWRVNSTRGIQELEPSSYSVRGRSSTLVYRPDDHEHDQDQYGVVFCQGKNRLGTQETPCMFLITPAGPPDEPLSCSLVNQSATSLGVSCVPGHDGGLSQTFLATVRDAGSQRVVAEVSSATPTFTVGGLAPGRDYLVFVTAANTKGHSSPYLIHGFALKVAENKINDSSTAESSHLLLVFLGAVSGFVLILTLLAVATRSRCRRRRRLPDVAADNNKPREEVPLAPLTVGSLDAVAEDDGTPPEVLTEVQEPQVPDSPSSERSSHTYVPTHPTHSSTLPRPHRHLSPRPQPLHSVDLPHITSNDHKYYTLKINCTRQNNESFV